MTNREILDIAMAQSAVDLNCHKEDFLKSEPVIAVSAASAAARRYLKLPFDCNLVSYGNNIVASISPQYRSFVEEYLNRNDKSHCFETPNLYELNQAFAPYHLAVCFMAEYFLPDLNQLKQLKLPDEYELRLLFQEDFAGLYTEEWGNALCRDRKELDVLGFGAYDHGKLIGLAGCSADCDSMWQIGIDVLPEYRRRGIASAVTSALALEVLARDKIPFYCCAWCNIGSARNAVKSGFRPAWAELTVKSTDYIGRLIGKELTENTMPGTTLQERADSIS